MIEWLITHAPDDAFLYLQLVTGRTSIFETNGYQPLWAFVLLPFGFFIKGEAMMFAATVLYYGILCAIPFVVYRLYGTWWGFLVWGIPALLSGNVMMELPLAVLVVLIAMRYKRPELSVLMIYARLDLAPLALMITPIRQWWKLALYYSPWIIFNLVAFGTVFPDSMLHASFPTSFSHMASLLGIQYTWPLIAIGIIGCSRSYRPLIYQFAILLAANIVRGAPFMWHFVVVPVMVVLGAKELHAYLGPKLRSYFPELRSVKNFGALIVLVLLIPTILAIPMISDQFNQNFVYTWQTSMYESRYIEVNGTRGAFNSGIQGYFSPQKVYNLDGVFNHNVVMTEYITDFEKYIPTGYELVKLYPNTKGPFGSFGLYKRTEK